MRRLRAFWHLGLMCLLLMCASAPKPPTKLQLACEKTSGDPAICQCFAGKLSKLKSPTREEQIEALASCWREAPPLKPTSPFWRPLWET